MDHGTLGKGLIFAVAFLGIFALILGNMPSEYFYTGSADDYQERPQPTEYWSAEDIKETKYWGNNTDVYISLTTWHTITIGPGTLDETARVKWFGEKFYFEHYWLQWGWYLVYGHIEPYPLYESEIRANIDDSGNASRFEMTCDHYNYIVYFNNNATYSNLTDALDNGHVVVSMGVGWEVEQAVLSGWDIVTRLLFFQPLPEIGDPLLTGIIALPIWTMIGFIVFITITLIVEMLPLT